MIMKYVTICFLTFISFSFFAQYSFTLNEGEYAFMKGTHHGFIIPIYESSIHDVEKDWKKLMKDWHGKVDEKKHEFFADDATFKNMGENSFDTYAYCKEKDGHIDFVVAVDLGGAFLNYNQHKNKADAFKKELVSFAKNASINGLNNKIKKEKHVQGQMQKDLEHLLKQKDKLNSDIESWKKEIEKAENDIQKNIKDQGSKKLEANKQSKLIESLENQKKKIK